jgi:5-methylcytosine-specific restriction endonuclease McrA
MGEAMKVAAPGPCFYCGRAMTQRLKYEYGMRPTDRSKDHVIPKARGGGKGLPNRVWACYACNEAKGAMLLDEWRLAMAIEGALSG